MACGRTVIVTNAGGTAELVTEDITGFVSKTDQDMLEVAMEKAWNKTGPMAAYGTLQQLNI